MNWYKSNIKGVKRPMANCSKTSNLKSLKHCQQSKSVPPMGERSGARHLVMLMAPVVMPSGEKSTLMKTYTISISSRGKRGEPKE